MIPNKNLKASFKHIFYIRQLIIYINNNQLKLNQNFVMADDIKRRFGGKQGSAPSDQSPRASIENLQDCLESQPIYKTAISLSSSHSDSNSNSDSVLEPSELFSTTDQELFEPKESINFHHGLPDNMAPQDSSDFVVVEASRQVEMEEFRARMAAARHGEEEDLDEGEADGGEDRWLGKGGQDMSQGVKERGGGEWRNEQQWIGVQGGQKGSGNQDLARRGHNGRVKVNETRVTSFDSESMCKKDNHAKTTIQQNPLQSSLSETQTTSASFSSPSLYSQNPYQQNKDEENDYATSSDDIKTGHRHPSEKYMTQLSDQNAGAESFSPREAVHKSAQPQGNEKREKCFFCFDLEKGISLLVRIQILTMMLFWYSFFFKIATNQFMDDPKMQMFLTIQAMTNSLRFYAAFLAWQWYQDDNTATRRKLRRSFLLWFLVDILAFLNKTYINHQIFGMSWAAYKFHKQYHVPFPTSQPPPPPLLPSPEPSLSLNTTHPTQPALPTAPHSSSSSYAQDLQSHLSFIHSFEKQKVLLRVLVWLPLKFYFYCQVVRIS